MRILHQEKFFICNSWNMNYCDADQTGFTKLILNGLISLSLWLFLSRQKEEIIKFVSLIERPVLPVS